LAFVSESIFAGKWILRLVDYVPIAKKPNVTRSLNFNDLNKTTINILVFIVLYICFRQSLQDD